MTGHVDERTLFSFAERGIKTIIRNRAWLKEHGISYDTLDTAAEASSHPPHPDGSEGIAFGLQGVHDEIQQGEVALVYALEMLEAADTAFGRARTLADSL